MSEKEINDNVKPEIKASSEGKIAVVRIRGSINLKKEVKDTLQMLRLNKQHTCSVFDKTPSVQGMLQKVKDFVTWGEIDKDTFSLLQKDEDAKSYRLHPPRGGFERKGIKKSYAVGGALGNRGNNINILIKKMTK